MAQKKFKRIEQRYQKYLDAYYNSLPADKAHVSRKTRNKRLKRDISEEHKRDVLTHHGHAVGTAINSLTEIIPIIDNDLIFMGDRYGERITVAHLGLGQEVIYQRRAYTGLNEPHSMLELQRETFEVEDQTLGEFNGKHRYARGSWCESGRGVAMKWPRGGAIHVGAPDGHDCIPAIMDAEDNYCFGFGEHLVTKSEVEGLGFGSLNYGHHVLQQLRNHWRHRGRFYAKRR